MVAENCFIISEVREESIYFQIFRVVRRAGFCAVFTPGRKLTTEGIYRPLFLGMTVGYFEKDW